VTIGFALTLLTQDQAAFLIAADARYSFLEESADIAIKTYSLGSRVGAVAAGSALSAFTAAEMVRGIADDHDRLSPQLPISFYSTVRLFSFFLDKIEKANRWSKGCEVVMAGFLANGSPALAKVLTRASEKTEVHCWAPKRPGSLVAMVGQPNAKEQIAAAMSRTFEESGRWIERATATILYLSKHDGEPTIGGGPGVAVCHRQGVLHWPFVIADGRTYLRGFDVTESAKVSGGEGVVQLSYDEPWHSQTDQDGLSAPVRRDEGSLWLSKYVEDWVLPRELFDWKVDPEALRPPPDLSLPPSVVVIVRPGELPGLPD
jgi:hypothetical protein